MKTNCRSSILLHKGGDYLLISVDRAEFLAAIKRATAIAPPDSPLDVLKGVLLETDSTRKMLTVTSTNLEVSLVEMLPCSAQEDGALVYSARTLAEMLQRLPEDTVEISRKENRGRMTLTSGSASYEVDVWDRGAFPKPDLPFPEDTVKVSGIPAMAQHTVFATAQDKDKPLLRCVNLMFTSTGLRAAGSNGMCIVTAKGDDQSTGDISLLVPALSLGKLAGMCKDEDEFRVGTTGKSIVFFKENFLFSARLIEGGYIDTDSLLKTISEKKQQATVHTLLRLSRLPTKAPRTFENFDFSLLKGRDVERLKALPSLSAIYSHRNLAFIGPAGTGKTHLAQAFGYACCQHGMKTYFIKASELRDRFLAAKRSGKADSCLNALVRPSCLIIDEIGHCEFDKECTRMFFDLIDRRYNKEGNFNMIFTSNKNPALWREDFNEDTTLLCALDRIFDDAMVFKLRGESFRGKKLETISLQTGKVKAVESVTEMKG